MAVSKPVSIGIIVASVAALTVIVTGQFSGVSGSQLAGLSEARTMIDAETLEVFVDFPVEPGTGAPFSNPETGEDTLYPAEECWWTEDGLVRTEPIYVLVKRNMGVDEPTYCPDCGRLVTPHNAFPDEEAIRKTRELEGSG